MDTGLKIRNFEEVFNNLVEWTVAKTERITDFNVGSATRTLYEAIAIQFEEFYFLIKQAVIYAIENAIYDSFGFPRRTAQKSTGFVTVEFVGPITRPIIFRKGTVFSTSGVYGYIYFEATEEVIAEKGSISVMVPVECKSEGKVGNVPSGTITQLVTTNPDIRRVYNPASFNNGSTGETSTERKMRFQNYIKTLAKGTRDAIIYGTLEVDGVAGAWVDDNYIGYVRLYAHNSSGDLPDKLKQEIITNLENYRSAGIEVEVLPIVKRPFDVTVRIMLDNKYDTDVYQELIHGLIERTLNEYVVSQSFYTADLIHAIKTVYSDMVVNILVLSGSDTYIAENELIRPGVVTVYCVNVKDWRS